MYALKQQQQQQQHGDTQRFATTTSSASITFHHRRRRRCRPHIISSRMIISVQFSVNFEPYATLVSKNHGR